MDTVLQEEQWELLSAEADGSTSSMLFGTGTNIEIVKDGLDRGSAEVRTQDADRSQDDGTQFGRDYLAGPEWSLKVCVQHGLDVWPVLHEFQQRWRADYARSQPGTLSTLRYRRGGVTYRMLGRARKCDQVAESRKNDHAQQMLATFKLADPEKYIEPVDTSRNTLRLDLVEAASDGGVVWTDDLTWPIEWRPSSQARTGEVTVGGFRPAPFRVQVFGPVDGVASKIRLAGDGWEIATTATVLHGQSFLIDTAARTIGRAGYSMAGTLSRTSRLSTARLRPGHQFITFDAVDPTNTAYAVVSWLDTVPA